MIKWIDAKIQRPSEGEVVLIYRNKNNAAGEGYFEKGVWPICKNQLDKIILDAEYMFWTRLNKPSIKYEAKAELIESRFDILDL